MRTELKFTFNPDEESDVKIYANAKTVSIGLWDLKQRIRTALKHGHTYKTADDVLEWIQEELFELTKGEDE